MEGIGKGVQIAVYVANAVIFLGGLVVFSIGVWTLAEKSFIERLAGSNLYVASAAILISTGIVVSIVSALGSYGAYREIRSLLLAFFAVLFLIFVLMMVAGILGYIFRSEVDERMQLEMVSSIKDYGMDDQVTDAWDQAQNFFKCCGITVEEEPGYAVWRRNALFSRSPENPNGARVPTSCCRSDKEPVYSACQSDSPNILNAYLESCYEKAKDYVKGHAMLIGGIGIGIACLLIFGMILSCALFLLIE